MSSRSDVLRNAWRHYERSRARAAHSSPERQESPSHPAGAPGREGVTLPAPLDRKSQACPRESGEQ